MEATAMSARGWRIGTIQVSANAPGACSRMPRSENSGLMPLLLGGATILCARMVDTHPESDSRLTAARINRCLLTKHLLVQPVAQFRELDAGIGDRRTHAKTPREASVVGLVIEGDEIRRQRVELGLVLDEAIADQHVGIAARHRGDLGAAVFRVVL